jgi:aminoglycoside/choline kinase family phosphotransferase
MSEIIPDGIDSFLNKAGWGTAAIDPIPGDASFRRYFRIADQDRKAMLMFAPPPEEDPKPFLHVAHWLTDNAMRAPKIFAEDAAQGWVLIEDFGDDRMRDWLDTNPQGETGAYVAAVDALARLHALPAGPFDPYDMAVYAREAALLTQWYCPAMQIDADADGYVRAWNAALAPMMARAQPDVTVLRDYHAENIMLLGPDETGQGEQGLIDAMFRRTWSGECSTIIWRKWMPETIFWRITPGLVRSAMPRLSVFLRACGNAMASRAICPTSRAYGKRWSGICGIPRLVR